MSDIEYKFAHQNKSEDNRKKEHDMKTSYLEKDVIILLKDITGKIEAKNSLEREKLIQSGIHYSELLPVEYLPTEAYTKLYQEALHLHAAQTAEAVMVLAEKIRKKKGENITLVSLARAGTPIGILLKRYLEKKYKKEVQHYSISIIRDRGIDHNAMSYILQRHTKESIQFVDGWIGKGAITKELNKAMEQYPGVNSELAVLADPAHITNLYGTTEDFLIPSACLNAPVSGLFSRTVLNDTLIGKGDFHGSVYYKEMEKIDVSYEFIETIEQYFVFDDIEEDGIERGERTVQNNERPAHKQKKIEERMEKKEGFKLEKKEKKESFQPEKWKTNEQEEIKQQEIKQQESGLSEVQKIAEEFGISNINYIKPGIGETTRVLMRRVPWKILISEEAEEKYIGHILRLCKEKKVEVLRYPLKYYRTCGIIRNMSDI